MTTEERLEKLEGQLRRARRCNRWVLLVVWTAGPLAAINLTSPTGPTFSRYLYPFAWPLVILSAGLLVATGRAVTRGHPNRGFVVALCAAVGLSIPAFVFAHTLITAPEKLTAETAGLDATKILPAV